MAAQVPGSFGQVHRHKQKTTLRWDGWSSEDSRTRVGGGALREEEQKVVAWTRLPGVAAGSLESGCQAGGG